MKPPSRWKVDEVRREEILLEHAAANEHMASVARSPYIAEQHVRIAE
jgi:hypothetical protein